MKIIKIIGLTVMATIGLAAVAIDLPNREGEKKVIQIISNNEVIAELRVVKPAEIKLETGDPGNVSVTLKPGSKSQSYLCKNGGTLVVSSGGKHLLTVTADMIAIDTLKGEAAK